MDLNNNELTSYELMVFEKYFYGDESIPLEELYFYFQVLRQTRDFSDSKHTINKEDSTKFEMINMNLKRDGENIIFEGSTSNGVECRCVNGIIKKKGKGYYVLTQVYRLHESVPENIREYYVYDVFRKVKDVFYQRTDYDESLSYRQEHGEDTGHKSKFHEFDMESFKQFSKKVGSTYTV